MRGKESEGEGGRRGSNDRYNNIIIWHSMSL